MLTDKIDAKDFPKMSDEYKDLVTRVLTIQADCEIGGPHLYVDKLLPGAPDATKRLVVARTAAEEVDHFRKVMDVAAGVGLDLTYLLRRSNQERAVDAFRGEITTWEDYGVFGFLIDRIGRYQMEEFAGCTYAPLDAICPGILSEELGHIENGRQFTAELANGTQDERHRVQEAVDRWYPKGLDMFGHSGSWRAERYMEWGLKRRPNETAREHYITEVNPLIEELGLQVPDPEANRKFF
ncbi:MAG TPA: Phenylacetic acid catabolic protein [Chloroflexota bacterium]|jgi:ring-1,2-phenylacetyl-CoA epoxidase subunit PaaA